MLSIEAVPWKTFIYSMRSSSTSFWISPGVSPFWASLMLGIVYTIVGVGAIVGGVATVVVAVVAVVGAVAGLALGPFSISYQSTLNVSFFCNEPIARTGLSASVISLRVAS